MAAAAERLIEKYDESSDVGRTALAGVGIKFEDLGLNDPLTHLDQYQRGGEAAMASIEAELVMDCAERLIDATFINTVGFRRDGNDFVSNLGGFSMERMAKATKDKIKTHQLSEPVKKRLEVEAEEPELVDAWFDAAEIGELLVAAESLPCDDSENYAITRFYRKLSDEQLDLIVVILHNPSLAAFNRARQHRHVPTGNDERDLMVQPYVLHPKHGQAFEEQIEEYVAGYDAALAELNPGQEYIFGLPAQQTDKILDGLEEVKKHQALLSIYTDTLRAIGNQMIVGKDLLAVERTLKLGLALREGQKLSVEQSREILDSALQYIVATLNRAPAATLEMLTAVATDDLEAAYTVAGHYGAEAREEGVRYESPACPGSFTLNEVAEQAALSRAHRHNADPTKCVMCPACRKVVDLPKKLYEKKILHCVNCKLTVKDGKKVDPTEVFGKTKQGSEKESPKETDWQRIKRQEHEKKLKRKAERRQDT